eukprot:Clim_evm21s240 gene=Clim_evmTU21s240
MSSEQPITTVYDAAKLQDDESSNGPKRRKVAVNGQSIPDSQCRTDNVRVKKIDPLIPPQILLEELPAPEGVIGGVTLAREAIIDALTGNDDRLVVIVGPCSIHDEQLAKDYAAKLKELAVKFRSELIIVMRVYFEKPRTTIGWKGLINDPDLDDSYQINKGLRLARSVLLHVASLGLPAGVEYLDTISPQYISDLVSWGAIGARTTESQLHRQLASGLSCPVGFKNATSGDLQVAVDAISSAKHEHHFMGATKEGLCAVVRTSGNPYCHVILRGGKTGPNYSEEHVQGYLKTLEAKKVDNPSLMVDCSHDNSRKDHKNQPQVSAEVARQVAAGNKQIFGVMIESNIKEGKQSLKPGVKPEYGVSVTDACVNLDTTDEMLQVLADAVKARRQ